MDCIFENTTTLTRRNLTEMARANAPKWSLLTGLLPAAAGLLAAGARELTGKKADFL